MTMDVDQRFDVVVVGAGPAGTHLALRLADLGHAVALVDKKHFPRRKPCGEFLSPECRPLLEQVGLGAILGSSGARRIGGMRLCGYGRRADGSFLPLGDAALAGGGTATGGEAGFALRREVLDLESFEAAARHPGITVLQGHALRRLLRDGDGAVTGVELADPEQRPVFLAARFTVGADGVHSRVASQLGVLRAVPWLDRFAVVARYAGGSDRNHAEVHFLDRAYLAMAPIDGDELTLNLVFDRSAMPKGRRELGDFLRRHIEAAPALADEIGSREPVEPLMACGPLAARTTRQVFDGAALVGDACGYVDPVTGEGLFFAMRGAALLADSLDASLRAGRNDARSLRGYVRARRREFGPRYAMARLLQRGMRHPAIVRAFLGTLQAKPRLADLLVTITGDSVSPAALLDPRRLLGALA